MMSHQSIINRDETRASLSEHCTDSSIDQWEGSSKPYFVDDILGQLLAIWNSFLVSGDTYYRLSVDIVIRIVWFRHSLFCRTKTCV